MSGFFSRKKGRKSPGQGLVEFALALPIFLLLLLGVVEFGRLLAMAASVYTAAREGARYGSAVGPGDNTTLRYQDCAGIRAAAKNVGFFAGLADSDIQIGYDNTTTETVNIAALPNARKCSGTTSLYNVTLGDRIVVQARVNFKFLFLGLPAFPITSQSARTIVSNIATDVTKGATFTPRPPTPGPSPTVTITPTPTVTPSYSATPTDTATSTPTPENWTPPTPTDTATATATVTPTDTLVPTPTVDDVCKLIIVSNVAGNLDTYFDLTFYNLDTATNFWLMKLHASWGPLVSPPTPTPAPLLTELKVKGAVEVSTPQPNPLDLSWGVDAPNRVMAPVSGLPLNFLFNQDSHIVRLSAEFGVLNNPDKICVEDWP